MPAMRGSQRSDAPRSFLVTATVGPASWSIADELVEAGADALRVNASHLQATELRARLCEIRDLSSEVPIVVDLQGAKMRLGWFDMREIRPSEIVTFSAAPSESEREIPLPHPALFETVSRGQTLTIDDGRVSLCVEDISGARLQAKALRGGALRPRKGVNIIEHPVELEELAEADVAAIDAVRQTDGVQLALSFMRDGREAAWVEALSPGCRLAGKIERAEAVQSLGNIAKQVDEIWICRGDLGEQIGYGDMARFVASLDPGTLDVPVMMAGQVLEHLTAHNRPTRSEICHLFDLVTRGYGGIVLSDETAIGTDPVNAVRAAKEMVTMLSTWRGSCAL